MSSRWEAGGAEAVAGHVACVLARGGARTIAIPGGRTPVPILRELARAPVAWDGVQVFLTDDRLVATDHGASNFGWLQRALGVTGARLVPLEAGAAPPRFDLVWIGMGEDGHVASVFPSALGDMDPEPAIVRTTPDPLPPEAPFERITLTLGALCDCEEMILVISGERKRALVEDALAGSTELPIGPLLARLQAPLTIYWTPA